MKKLISLLLAVSLIIPQATLAAFGVGFNATSTTQGWVSPNYINGNPPSIAATSYNATSSTATSTFRGGLNVGSYYLGIGTSTSGFTQGINIPDQSKITAITTGTETGWDYGLLNWNMFIGTGGQRNTIDHTISQPDPLYPTNAINGLYNTFVGMGAGDANTVGNLNTFLGSLAGAANTTGGQNTFLGSVAGFSNTTGIHNTYLGVGAGESNIAGNHNVAVGTDALLTATNTLSTIAIGSGAGANDNGSYNISIGESALAVGNWGNSLVAISPGALQNNSFGNKSIGIGRAALFYATSSDNNIAIGYNSGKSSPQPGNDNIFIGSDTYSAPGVYNSIAIGTSTYLGESNLIVLGNNQVQKSYIGGRNGTGTVYAPNLQVSGNVGIGTTNPYNKLHTNLTSGQLALFGSQGLGVTNGNYAGIALGYSEAGPLYQKSAIVQSQVGDGSARGSILFLNNGTASNANASLADARMAITYAGNVGIGTTSPSQLLTVGNNNQFTVTSAGAATAASVQVGNMTVGTTGFYAGGGTAGQGRFYYDSTNGSTIQGQTASTYDTALTNASGSILYANPKGTSVNYFAGNVGIGTTSPGQKLSVAGDILGNNIIGSYFTATTSTATSTLAGGLSVAGAAGLAVLQNGNIGIGTASPAVKVHISDGTALHANIITALSSSQFVSSKSNNGTQAATLFTTGGTATDRSVFYMMRARGTTASPTAVTNNDQVGDLLFGAYDGSTLQNTAGLFAYVDGTVSSGVVPMRLSFVTGATNSASRAERLTVKSNGNVGIGTTTPTTQLQVTASASNATSTLTVGKVGQNKGSCLELFDSAGTAVYAYIAAGATTFTLSSISCK